MNSPEPGPGIHVCDSAGELKPWELCWAGLLSQAFHSQKWGHFFLGAEQPRYVRNEALSCENTAQSPCILEEEENSYPKRAVEGKHPLKGIFFLGGSTAVPTM